MQRKKGLEEEITVGCFVVITCKVSGRDEGNSTPATCLFLIDKKENVAIVFCQNSFYLPQSFSSLFTYTFGIYRLHIVLGC